MKLKSFPKRLNIIYSVLSGYTFLGPCNLSNGDLESESIFGNRLCKNRNK